MPRYNNDGRTAKFVHTGGGGGGGHGQGGRGGGFQGQGGKFNDFKFTSQKNRGIQKKHKGPKIFQRLDEAGDVIMGGGGEPQPSSSGQGGNRRNRKDRTWRNKLPNKQKEKNFIFGPSWHRIMILDGTSLNRDLVLSSLVSACRVPFTPVAYSCLGTNTAFFVEDRAAAQALAECSGKILGDNQELKLRIMPNQPPTANFDTQCETKVKAELERRYNSQFQTLSLSNFLMSPELIKEYFLPLTRSGVAIKLLNLLGPLLNNLVGIDLSSNRLVSLDGFQGLTKKAPSLKALNLSKNKFQNMHDLDRLHGLQIVELILEENPVCNKYSDKDKYIRSFHTHVSLKPDSSLIVRSDVRKRFPKVTKLDGVDIPAPITFEVAEPVKMPDVRGSSFCNEEAKKVVLAFWEQYVSLYDSNDRQLLMQAYHETATMSLMASYTQPGHVSQMDPIKKLSLYLGDSRNLLRNPDKHRKYKLLHQGKLDIMAFLQKLPKTTHDPASFVIDMPVAVENFILFNVVGLIKEREERHTPIRYFSRTFAVVPQNGGFVIVNELYFVTNATPEQVKGAFKPVPTTSAVIAPVAPIPGPSMPAAAATVPRVLTDEEKRVMLASFSQQSGMNHEWSLKCLEENEWDFNKSAFVFSQLKEQGKIPPEAFIK